MEKEKVVNTMEATQNVDEHEEGGIETPTKKLKNVKKIIYSLGPF